MRWIVAIKSAIGLDTAIDQSTNNAENGGVDRQMMAKALGKHLKFPEYRVN